MDLARYPLATLEEMPLHAGAEDFGDDRYYACMDKEWDYNEDQTLYDWRCPDCLKMARMNVWAYGDNEQEWRPSLGENPRVVQLTWLVKRADYWSYPHD